MNHGSAALHRISVGLFGVLCLALAVAVAAFRFTVDPVSDWISRLDTAAISDTAAQTWFAAVLAAVALVAAYWGWRLIRTTIAPRRPEQPLSIAGSGPEGTMSIPLQQVAQAVQEQLSTQTMFRKVAAQALDDRDRRIIAITVDSRPDRTYDQIVAAVEPAIDDLRTAFDGSDVHVQVMVHLDARE